jgi:DNA invertase Pin-like site-specific DNA recombinase
MATYGYARVSTIDQDLSLQRRTLKAAGCDVIRAEKASGTRRSGRSELQVLLDFLRPGDTLVVTRSIGWRAASATCRTSYTNSGSARSR